MRATWAAVRGSETWRKMAQWDGMGRGLKGGVDVYGRGGGGVSQCALGGGAGMDAEGAVCVARGNGSGYSE